MAKGIANGFPMGVCLARGEAATTLVPGDHGSTFGGQPLACSAALATLDVLEKENLIENAAQVGTYFLENLFYLQKDFPTIIKEVRGKGLMVGIEFAQPIAKSILNALIQSGIIANAIGDYTLRFLPPLSVSRTDCNFVVQTLKQYFARQNDLGC